MFNISVLLDVQANLPETSPFFCLPKWLWWAPFFQMFVVLGMYNFDYSTKCRAISIHQVWLTTFPKRLTMMQPTTSKAWRSWNRDYHFEQKRRGYSSRKLAQAFCLHLVSGTQTLNKEKPLKNKRREEAGRRHFAAPLTADVRAYSTPLDALWSAAALRRLRRFSSTTQWFQIAKTRPK